MARARNIKPAFFINEELVECDFATRLLFIGLWTLSDREGRLEDKPKKIKMALFPADNIDVDACLNELASCGLINRYEIETAKYIQVITFQKHQNPHRDEKPSTIPAQGYVHVNKGNLDAGGENKPADKEIHGASTVQARCKDDANSVAIGLNPESFNLIPETLCELSESADNLTSDEDIKKLTHTQMQVSEIAKALTAVGMQPFNCTLPAFLALIEAGATAEEFTNAAIEQKGNPSKFNFKYLLAMLTNRRAEVANINLHKGAMPNAPPQNRSVHDRRSATAKAMFGDINHGNNTRIIDVSDCTTEANRPLISTHG